MAKDDETTEKDEAAEGAEETEQEDAVKASASDGSDASSEDDDEDEEGDDEDEEGDDEDEEEGDDEDEEGDDEDEEEGDDEDEEDEEEAGSGDSRPPSHAPAALAVAHAGHGGHEEHGLGHVTPLSLLFGILGTLLFLTIITVAVTSFDLGAELNLTVAMVIATLKAALVVTYFMHLRWDYRFHLILFLGSILFVILFLSGALTDRAEYQQSIDYYTTQQASPPAK